MTGAEIAIISLAAAGTGIAGYSAYQSGVDAKAQANQQAAFAEYNAKVAQRQAEAERAANLEASRQHARRTQMALARMRSQIGKSGATETGSPLLVLEDTANQFELERASVIARGEGRATAMETQSILDLTRAEAFEASGSSAYRSGLIGAGGQLAMGGAQVAGYYNKFNSPGTLTSEGKATIAKY